MSKLSALREVGRFLKTRKRYWLVPIIVVFVLVGGLLVIAEGSAVAPLIYTLF
jgi:hypothetical protein